MKILVIRLGSLGDVILATPVVEILRRSIPDAEVDFLVKKEFASILDRNSDIRRVIPFDGRGVNKGLNGVLAMARELKGEGYACVIDLHGNLRSRIICALVQGATVYRYDKQAIKRRLLLWGFRPHVKHTLDAYLTALESLPVDTGLRPGPKIHLSSGDERAASELLDRNLSHSSLLIGLNPGAKWATKRWTEEGFIETGKRIINELGGKVIVFGGPDEKGLSDRIAEAMGSGAFSVAGKVSLMETAALIKRCKVFATNDSGPMHMATAVGTPVVAIFGPTVQGFGFSPLGKSIVVEKDVSCRPCSLHGSESCPKGHFECMKGIGADEVFQKVKKIINLP